MRVGELRVASLRVASWLTNLRCRIFLCYYFFRSSPLVFHRSIIFQKETTQLLFLLELSVTLVLLWNYFSFLIVLRQSKSTFLVLIFEKYQCLHFFKTKNCIVGSTGNNNISVSGTSARSYKPCDFYLSNRDNISITK